MEKLYIWPASDTRDNAICLDDEFNLILTRRRDPVPTPKLNYLEIPLSNLVLDFTEFNGAVHFEQAKWHVTYTKPMATRESWLDLFYQLQAAVHGEIFRFSFGSEPDLVHTGRFSLSDWRSSGALGTFVLEISQTAADRRYVTISFNANEGSGTMAPMQVVAGIPAELDANAFTCEGYVFDGWNTAADGSGTSYADEDTITVTEDTMLYAQWAEPAVWAPCGDATLIYIGADNGLTYHFRDSQQQEITPAVGDNLDGCEYYVTGTNTTGKERYWLAYNAYTVKALMTTDDMSSKASSFECIRNVANRELIGSTSHTIGDEVTYSAGKYYTYIFLLNDSYEKTQNTAWKQLLTIRMNTGLDDWFIPSLDELYRVMDGGSVQSAWMSHASAQQRAAWTLTVYTTSGGVPSMVYIRNGTQNGQSVPSAEGSCIYMRCF